MTIKRLLILLFVGLLAFSIQPKALAVSDNYKIIDYAGDATFAAYLTDNHEIYVVGSNSNGQLGRGFKDNNIKMNPTEQPIIGNVKKFAAGKNNFIVVITNDNRIFGWGSNQYGQLAQFVTANTKDNDLLVPTSIPIGENLDFIDLALGARHTMILDSNGDVWVFGDNSFGQLGILEEVSNRNKIFGTPTKIDASYFNNEKVVQIAASEYTSYALTETGDVYAWGTDYQGQLVIGDDHDIELLGTTEKMINYPVKTRFSDVVSIKARSENVGVMTTDQKVFVAGSNTLKQLGVSSYTNLFSNTPIEVTEKYTKDGTAIVSDIVDFEIGGVANFILLENGDLLSFGSGGSYELGYPVAQVTSVYRQLSTIIAPTKVTFYEPIDLEVIESISESIYRNQIPLNKTIVIDVEIDDIVRTSGDRTMVRDTEGRFWSFGNNSSGMVASGNVTTVDAPVLSTLYRVEFYDEAFISKNYLIEPLIGVIVTLSLFVGVFIYLEIKLQKQRKREKQFIEMLNSNQITRT